VARDVARLFGKLYAARFPIHRMRLVDRYGADDKRSMKDDNTSAFNCRYRNGVCCTWSMHAYGKAIDLNPVENPYVSGSHVSPEKGAKYADRCCHRAIVHAGDKVVRAFASVGWGWGGYWSGGTKDYQHFSTTGG
jgi:poly-gamma-glutamate synthesis protein (capsule biosynthesis protein)